MRTDGPPPDAFYATPHGTAAAGVVAARMVALWPSARRLDLLGIGHAAPYLTPFCAEAARCLSLVTPVTGASRWPPTGPSATSLADDGALPFADLAFDRILLVHGLENAENARRLLRETWRVLRDDGRLLIVAANRRGLWAHADWTPFGQGRPYSTGQVQRLLGTALFQVEACTTALFTPPTASPLLWRLAPLIERAGATLAPGLAGVTLTEAVKTCWSAVPVRAPARRITLMEPA